MTTENSIQSNWRIKAGFALFVFSVGWPIFIPVLPLLGVSAKTTAAVSGIMMVAAELMLIAGAALAGKDGFAFIKAKVLGVFKTFLTRRPVSRGRYRFGLVLFSGCIIFAWIAPYVGHHFPGFEQRPLVYAVSGDILLLFSLFMLGEGFWEKLQALYRYDVAGADG